MVVRFDVDESISTTEEDSAAVEYDSEDDSSVSPNDFPLDEFDPYSWFSEEEWAELARSYAPKGAKKPPNAKHWIPL